MSSLKPLVQDSSLIFLNLLGVANPGPIIASLWVDDDADSTLQLDGVVTVVDCVNVLQYLSSPGIF